jgi:hypothetical protein
MFFVILSVKLIFSSFENGYWNRDGDGDGDGGGVNNLEAKKKLGAPLLKLRIDFSGGIVGNLGRADIYNGYKIIQDNKYNTR